MSEQQNSTAAAERPISAQAPTLENPISETATYDFTLIAYEEHGLLHLKWETTAPFRAHQGIIAIYEKTEFPKNPEDNRKAWRWDDESKPWNTGLLYGKDWYCAWIAQTGAYKPFTYAVKLITK